MIRSMTAYATAERATDGGTLACELRAVNHRFLELGLRLPEELRVLEPALRERISARIARGKLDFSLRLRSPEGEGAVRINQDLIKQLAAVALELDAHFPQLRAEFVDLLQYPGVLQTKSVDAEALRVAVGHPQQHRHLCLLLRCDGVGHAVQEQALLTQRFAVVRDVDQGGVVIGLRLEQPYGLSQEMVGVEHGIVVGVYDSLALAIAQLGLVAS